MTVEPGERDSPLTTQEASAVHDGSISQDPPGAPATPGAPAWHGTRPARENPGGQARAGAGGPGPARRWHRPRLRRPPDPRQLWRRARGSGPWPLGLIGGVGVAATGALSLLAIVLGSLTITGLSSARSRVVDRLDPAAFQALQLDTALINQETGVRGYALTATPGFLQPYSNGVASAAAATARLRGLLADEPTAEASLAVVTRRAAVWRARYAVPTITQVRRDGKPAVGGAIALGKPAFDMLRRSVQVLQANIGGARRQGMSNLHHASAVLTAVCITLAVLLVLIVLGLALGLHTAVLQPLTRLAAEARLVADGDFGHEVSQSGPREVRELAADVNRMRQRILRELSALQARSRDLERSNSELEQFAYVASHDLQEPLRKVASFCQLLERRYAGQLDERANQYIDLAVDGAKRMQALIADLLAFSRVGRAGEVVQPVPLAAALGQAMADLSSQIESSGARIEVGALPLVQGEETLLTSVFANLLSNALKFHGSQPPHIAVSARRDGDSWLLSVSDNGIGIPPEFAERVFVIFQRLHGRSEYPGTGIGLAMCRKIIEHHGGRIWVDTSAKAGSRVCFTLPARAEAGGHDR